VPGAGGRSESMVAEPSEVVPAAPLSQDAAFRRAKTRGAEISGGGGYGGGLESGAFEKERLVEGRGDLGDRATRSAQKQETAERAPPLRQEESDPTFAYRASGYGIGSQVARATNTISRSEREFENRQRSMRENIRQFTENERNEFGDGSAGEDNDLLQRVSMGNGRPVWVGSNLLFARTVLIDDRKIIQGCWLDWQRIERMLLAEASHLPGARLIPVTETAQTNLGHMLATLPVRLEVDFVPEPISGLTPIRISLLVTWICLLFAFLALSALLLGVIRLSERRAAFVSAVTHELRTPLTTFRIYSDMLADDMVSDANQRRQYLQTLRSEADRLRHMVENVLAYARLERGRSDQRSTIQVDRLSERTVPRLSERAANAGMEFVARLDPDAAEKTLYVNATVIEQILFNLVDNACKYAREAANPKIDFDVESDADQIRFTIRDYGPGLPVKRRWQNWRPFSKTVEEAAHTAPGIGLGLALCQRLAIDSGGSLQVDNAPPSDAPGTIAALRLPVAKG